MQVLTKVKAVLAFALLMMLAGVCQASVTYSRSPLWATTLFTTADGPGRDHLGVIVPLPFSFEAQASVSYSRSGNTVYIDQIQLTTQLHDVVFGGNPAGLVGGLKIDVYENGRTRVATYVPVDPPQSWYDTAHDVQFGGIAYPRRSFCSPTFVVTATVISTAGTGVAVRSWGFQLNRETIPLYRYLNYANGDRFYASDWNEIRYGVGAYVFEQRQCWMESTPEAGTVPLYRYYNAQSGLHFYTTNWNELGDGRWGFRLESVVGYVFPAWRQGTVPLYRYLDTGSGAHFYTTNWGELGGGRWGYAYEGVQCYVYP